MFKIVFVFLKWLHLNQASVKQPPCDVHNVANVLTLTKEALQEKKDKKTFHLKRKENVLHRNKWGGQVFVWRTIFKWKFHCSCKKCALVPEKYAQSFKTLSTEQLQKVDGRPQSWSLL